MFQTIEKVSQKMSADYCKQLDACPRYRRKKSCNEETGERSSVCGVEASSLARLSFDVVHAELVPQAETVVVQTARITLENGGPLGFTLVDDVRAKVHVVEAGVVALTETSGSGGIGRAHPNIHVTFIVDDTTSISGQGAVNVDLIVVSAVVQAIEELSVSLDGVRNI